MQYAETYQRSISESEAFWAERANDIPWFTAPQVSSAKMRMMLHAGMPTAL